MPAFILTKDQVYSLKKDGADISIVTVGLAWDPVEGCNELDLDVMAILDTGKKQGAVPLGKDMIYFHKRVSDDHAIELCEDNRSGNGAGDDELLWCNLSLVPQDVPSVHIWITIFGGKQKEQTFGQIKSATCKLYTGKVEQISTTPCCPVNERPEQLAEFNMKGGDSAARSIHVATFYRFQGGWRFQTVERAIPTAETFCETEYAGLKLEGVNRVPVA
ncbi:TerD domain-containing protein [Xylariaceae sp. FL0255]|nr:TerD domain-containing protein [Xylariaceae sp. FL0255]